MESAPPKLSPQPPILTVRPASKTATTTPKGGKFDRQLFESVIKRRFFFTEAFEIYRLSPNFKGDNRGLFDYGPPGCALQANIVDLWRKHFVFEENMLELDCTVVSVLIAPLSSNTQLNPISQRLSARLWGLGIANMIDASSASIGRRYARVDELGTPLGVTVDFDTLKDGSVTLRERDHAPPHRTMLQMRS